MNWFLDLCSSTHTVITARHIRKQLLRSVLTKSIRESIFTKLIVYFQRPTLQTDQCRLHNLRRPQSPGYQSSDIFASSRTFETRAEMPIHSFDRWIEVWRRVSVATILYILILKKFIEGGRIFESCLREKIDSYSLWSRGDEMSLKRRKEVQWLG